MPVVKIEGIKTIPAIPHKGEQYLSVNLALVSFPELAPVATELGFTTELVQVAYPVGASEIHALLWCGSTNDTPADINQRIDILAGRIPTASIRSVQGATIESIKTFPYRPIQGRRFLSVNLALVDLTELTEFAKELGFKPELIKIQGESGTQVHALLWEGAIADTPPDMDKKLDYLADRINTDAIRYATGAWTQAS